MVMRMDALSALRTYCPRSVFLLKASFLPPFRFQQCSVLFAVGQRLVHRLDWQIAIGCDLLFGLTPRDLVPEDGQRWIPVPRMKSSCEIVSGRGSR